MNTEIEISCIDSDIASDKALHMINFIRPLFEELREFTYQYTFQDANEEISFFKDVKSYRIKWVKMYVVEMYAFLMGKQTKHTLSLSIDWIESSVICTLSKEQNRLIINYGLMLFGTV